jgi:hypothetical protein
MLIQLGDGGFFTGFKLFLLFYKIQGHNNL